MSEVPIFVVVKISQKEGRMGGERKREGEKNFTGRIIHPITYFYVK